jgi:hypothetical protein
MLLAGGILLHQQNLLDNGPDAGVFRSEVALCIAPGHAEQSRQR